MSVRAMTAVWEYSRAKGSGLTLLLAIADCANDEGERCYPGIERLARKTRLTVRHVQRALRSLEKSGELQVSPGTGPHGCNEYSLKKFLQYHSTKGAKISPQQTEEKSFARPAHRETGSEKISDGVEGKHGGDNLSGVTTCRGDNQGAVGVTFVDQKCHPIRKEPSLNREGDATSLLSLALGDGAVQQNPEEVAVKDAWREWWDDLDEREIRVSRRARLAAELQGSRYPAKRQIEVLRFSILKRAKHPVWDVAEREIPRHLRYEPETGSGTQGTTPAPVVPGLREWLAKHYPTANQATGWDKVGVSIRQQFAAAHPELKFRGLELQFYEGRAA